MGKEVSEDENEKVTIPSNEKSCLHAKALALVYKLCQLIMRGAVKVGN